jgi:hypothetical protein
MSVPNRVGWRCPNCHRIARVRPDRFPVHCSCGLTQLEYVPGLGDYVARCLRRIGIYPAKWIAAKRWLGLAPRCGCKRRQKSLNRLGNRVLQTLAHVHVWS